MKNLILLFIGVLLTAYCASAQDKLPDNLQWLTNETSPVFADINAKKGGTFHASIQAFPLTMRTIGPDSNSSFRSAILGNQMSLIGIHPNTEEILPELATHWAFGADKKTMYFKLDPRARWSDGKPVAAEDYIYTLEFMRSKHIVAPWYNNYYTEEIDRVIKFDEHTIAVVATKAKPDLHLTLGLSPTPRHFYGELDDSFVRKFNWEICPNTGPYVIDKINKGKSITFKRKKDWWAKDLYWFKGRFNVDKVEYSVIRDVTTEFEYFKKGELDAFGLTLPNYWHQQAKDLDITTRGYAHKLWFYTDAPQPSYGFWLNQDKELFKDPNVRYAFAHAIDMDKLLKEVLRGDYQRLHNQFTGYGKYTNTSIKAREFDIAKVEALMKTSGWQRGTDGIWIKNGTRFSVNVVYSSEPHTERLVVLREEALKAGIEMNLQRLDGSAAFKMVLEKNHDVAWMAYGTGLRPQYWEFYHSVNAHVPQTNNITNTDNPEMDKLIDIYRNSTDEQERVSLSRQIQEKIHEIGAYVPTYMVGYFREMYWRWWKLPKVPATKMSDSAFEPFGTGLFWFDRDTYEETQKAMKTGKTFEPVTLIDTTFRK
ncbi:MAG: ABC transporter substrate-binding protein [SAR324 cluster bacterium]|nr:ABC transporter substrate-binding protein [SAR324 cluster bacterium]